MNQLDRLYRALIDYRKQTVNDRECDDQRASIANANATEDLVEIKKTICTIDMDWIDAIEKGLVFVEKAISEERQFIRSNGEVVPIEKVKRVDKESVEHLARHSNLITKEYEKDNIIPDQLYTVERLSDFAVYENRFLYMLLCYLRDFITLRYNKIIDLTTTYDGKLELNKTISHRRQKVQLKLELTEQRKNDWYLKEHNEAKSVIERIDLILKAVVHYLSTPLMEEVSKSPMLKPPITKTNVLKMNQNFKKCVELYEYVASYDKPGYIAEPQIKHINPFPDLIADEFAEAVSLVSFLTYEHGLGIENYLKEEYAKEEERRKKEAEERFLEQLKNLRKRIKEFGESPEEYMLMLEKRNRSLESASIQLVIAKQEIEKLNAEIDTLKGTIEDLNNEVDNLNREIVRLKEEHAKEIERLNVLHAEEIERLNTEHAKEIERLNDLHAEEIERLNTEHAEEIIRINDEHAEEVDRINIEHATEIDTLNTEHADEIQLLNTEHEEEVARLTNDYTEQIESQRTELTGRIENLTLDYETRLSELTERTTTEINTLTETLSKERKVYADTIKEKQEEYSAKEEFLRAQWRLETAQWKERMREKKLEVKALNEKCKDFDDQRKAADGRLNAIRFEHGLITDEKEFASQINFDELEHQYRALKTLFKTEWGKVKKEMREKYIWSFFRKDKEESNTKANILKENNEPTDVKDQNDQPEILNTEIATDQSTINIVENDTETEKGNEKE